MLKNQISIINPKNKGKVTFIESMLSYDADLKKYGCLMKDMKKK